MARLEKIGLNYFSHDVEMSADPKIKYLKAKFKLIGYAVYNKLLEEVYKEKGYYLEINDRYIFLFADENGIDVDILKSIIDACLDENLFDKKLFAKYKIITSKRIQQNYIKGCERRKSVNIISEYLLINPDAIKHEKANVNISLINVNKKRIKANINGIDTNKSTQKEKEKEKEKENVYTNIPPTLIEVVERAKELNYSNVEIETNKFYNYYESNGWKVSKNKMVNWSSALVGWFSRSGNFNNNGNSEKAIPVKSEYEKAI